MTASTETGLDGLAPVEPFRPSLRERMSGWAFYIPIVFMVLFGVLVELLVMMFQHWRHLKLLYTDVVDGNSESLVQFLGLAI